MGRRRSTYTRRRKYTKKRSFRKKRFTGGRGMQKIRTKRYGTRNIGGDRAITKLRYVIGEQFTIPTDSVAKFQNFAMNCGDKYSYTDPLIFPGILKTFGSTPGLSVLAKQFSAYRIKGIGLKLTYWSQTGVPVLLYTNAAPDTTGIAATDTGPVPDFVTPDVSTVTEQRWCKYRTCQATSAGGRPTTLRSYYSVNKIQGPDNVIRNDEEYTGKMMVGTPYWDNVSTSGGSPGKSPWVQFGITTLSGDPVPAESPTTGVLKVEATVYAQFWQKRAITD